MFDLLVYPGMDGVSARFSAERAATVLELIPRILAEHDGCERVVVMFNDTRLFAVDCAGNRLP